MYTSVFYLKFKRVTGGVQRVLLFRFTNKSSTILLHCWQQRVNQLSYFYASFGGDTVWYRIFAEGRAAQRQECYPTDSIYVSASRGSAALPCCTTVQPLAFLQHHVENVSTIIPHVIPISTGQKYRKHLSNVTARVLKV